MKKNKSYLTFYRYHIKGKKTINVEVRNDSEEIGDIAWDTAWRRYVFVTIGEGYKFDAGCEREIADHLDMLMEERKTNG